jgi:2-polyprenyl-3-methyl-5-hydroxy-6-metoxy-1,4-benzoquinol methylase
MEERHVNRDVYFKEQFTTFDKYIFPFIENHKKIDSDLKVLEIGCGFGGNLIPFLEKGCDVVGIDIDPGSIKSAQERLSHYERLELIAEDIYKVEGLEGKFDLIFMKDTLEHIPNQEEFLKKVKHFLKPNGIMYQGFPPWCNPFGGHQQMSTSKFLSKLPWFHLYPRFMFKWILQMFGETEVKVNDFLTGVYDTRISIRRFEKICRKENYQIDERIQYFINPNYEVKFNLKPRTLPKWLSIPIIKEFYTTTCYYIVSYKETK